ncbi:BON domain-containing protein [Deinococcus sonorensis]|uniref:BON domain-containing protein n=2 Tax=Deinococcus sonorensis TaxID=309891 RepID=A0AAU7UDL2_9DEIO
MTNRRDDRYDDAARMDDQRYGNRRQDDRSSGRNWQAESNTSPDVLRYDEDLGYSPREGRSGQGQWTQGQGSQGPWSGDRSGAYGRGMGGGQGQMYGQGYGRQMGGDTQWRGGGQGGSGGYGQGNYGQGGDRMRRYMDDNQGYGTENEDYTYMRQEQYGQGHGMGRGWRENGGQDSEMRFRPMPDSQYSQQGMGQRQGWSGMGGQDQRSGGMMQSHQGKGPRGYQRSDDRIRESVNDALEDDHGVDASDIEVQVQGGEVTLTGTVTDRMQKRRAEDVAESLRGVRDVHNQLRVSAEGRGAQAQMQGQDSPVISSSQTSSSGPSSGQGQGGGGAGSTSSGGLSASSVRISDDVSR